MGVKDDRICRRCLHSKETVVHVLCEHEVYSAYRFEQLPKGGSNLKWNQVQMRITTKKLSYIKPFFRFYIYIYIYF